MCHLQFAFYQVKEQKNRNPTLYNNQQPKLLNQAKSQYNAMLIFIG